ncbi:MAG: response regulator [Sphaerochaeta sp.]
MKLKSFKLRHTILVVGFLLALIFPSLILKYQNKQENLVINNTLDTYAKLIEKEINSYVEMTSALEGVINFFSDDISEDEFNAIAQALYNTSPWAKSIQYVPQGIVTYSYPLEGNEEAIGHNLFEDPKRVKDVTFSRDNNIILLSGPYSLKQGGTGFILRNPYYNLDQNNNPVFGGFSVVILSVQTLVDEFAENDLHKMDYSYQIYVINENGDKTVLAGDENMDLSKANIMDLETINNDWHLALYKNKSYNYYKTSIFVFILIMMIALFLYLLILTYERKKQNEIREHDNRLKHEILSHLSHEMKTPLSIILGIAQEQIENPDISQEQINNYNSISHYGKYLLNSITNLLNMEDIKEGKFVLQKAETNLQTLCDEIQDISTYLTKEFDVKLTYEFKNTNPYIESVITDKVHLEQAIIYLIDNAVKFRREENPFVELYISYKPIDDTNLILEIEVNDNGVGISKEFLPHIFDGFKKEISDASSDLKGFGIGMFIVKSLITQFGGTIEVKSKKNVGTNIKLNVPMEIRKMENIENNLIFKCKHVLVCEDNRVNAKLLIKILESVGMIVDFAEDGAVGLEMFKNKSYDIVLMDIRMPVMDGYEAARKMRELNQYVPIVAVSANALDSDIKKTIESGMNDHVAKPFNKQVLLTKIKLQLQNSK